MIWSKDYITRIALKKLTTQASSWAMHNFKEDREDIVNGHRSLSTRRHHLGFWRGKDHLDEGIRVFDLSLAILLVI